MTITEWALNECNGDEGLALDLLAIVLRAMALELRQERGKQCVGYERKGTPLPAWQPKLPPKPLDGSEDRL